MHNRTYNELSNIILTVKQLRVQDKHTQITGKHSASQSCHQYASHQRSIVQVWSQAHLFCHDHSVEMEDLASRQIGSSASSAHLFVTRSKVKPRDTISQLMRACGRVVHDLQNSRCGLVYDKLAALSSASCFIRHSTTPLVL